MRGGGRPCRRRRRRAPGGGRHGLPHVFEPGQGRPARESRGDDNVGTRCRTENFNKNIDADPIDSVQRQVPVRRQPQAPRRQPDPLRARQNPRRGTYRAHPPAQRVAQGRCWRDEGGSTRLRHLLCPFPVRIRISGGILIMHKLGEGRDVLPGRDIYFSNHFSSIMR